VDSSRRALTLDRWIAKSHALGMRPERFAFALLVVIVGGLLSPSLTGRDRLAFRDVSQFYTPFYGYIAQRERSEWLPLYNPLDQTGMPLAGETTTALFYPIRRILFRIFATPETAIAWYVATHLLIAGVTATWAARRAGATRYGASLAMLSYPLAGPVWFLYTNPPFLAGAAWLPLAMGGGLGLMARFRIRDAIATAVGLAMAVLAGDPQTSVHVVLVGMAAWTVYLVSAGLSRENNTLSMRFRGPLLSAARLAVVLLIAILLAAPQVAASIDWAPQSVRYENQAAKHPSDIFDFSVPPWHWPELVVPALSGHLFPVYSRVSHLFHGDGRTWSITLYSGLIPLALALTRYRYLAGKTTAAAKRRRRVAVRRLDGWDAIAPLGLLLAMGSFSAVTLFRMLFSQRWGETDEAMFGPYGWLVAWVPGYSGFRYPAKWLVLVPLGISIAAARQVGHFSHRRTRMVANNATACAACGFVIAALVVLSLNMIATRDPERLARNDSIWGPLNWQVAAWSISTSTLGIVCIAKLFDAAARRKYSPQTQLWGALLLTAIDLGLVASPTLATINRAAEQKQLSTASPHSLVAPLRIVDSEGLPVRAMRMSARGWPPSFAVTPSPGAERLLHAEASMRASLFARWPLEHDLAVINSLTSLPPQRMRAFWTAANRAAGKLSGDDQRVFWQQMMVWLAVNQAWTVIEMQPAGADPSQRKSDPSDHWHAGGLLTVAPPFLQVSPSPAFWCRHWRERAEVSVVTPAMVTTRIEEILADSSNLVIPLVEIASNQRPTSDKMNLPGQTGMPDQPRLLTMVQDAPDSWKICVDASESGLVCIKQFQDGNLTATLRSADASGDRLQSTAKIVTVHRCDFLFSAFKVPPGKSEIILTYSPRWLLPSLAAALATWTLLGWLFIRPRRLSHRSV